MVCSFGRPGEQHSFILRPVNQVWNQHSLEDTSAGNLLLLDTQKPNGTRQTDGQIRTADIDELDSGVYAVLVSCHCSHTGEHIFQCYVVNNFQNYFVICHALVSGKVM